MAFPQVHTTTFVEKTADTTSHDVDLTGILSSDRAVLFAVVDNDGTPVIISGLPAGWAKIANIENLASGGLTLEVWEKTDASGSEPSFTYTTSTSQKSMNRVYLVSDSHSTQAMEASAHSQAANTAPDSISLTPSWATDDTLWITLFGVGTLRGKATSYPTSYSNNQHTFDSVTGDNTRVNYGVATRELNAASEDPGAFVKNSTDSWRAFTLAIRPKVGTTVGIGEALESDFARIVLTRLAGQWPEAPSGLTGVSTNPNQVDLAWTAITHSEGRIISYDVERDSVVIAKNVSAPAFIDIGLTPNTTYSYRVRGVFEVGATIRISEEFVEALAVGSFVAPRVGQSSERDISQSVVAIVSGTGGFGAGASGAGLAIPPGAVTATAGTLEDLINLNESGTDFALQPGTYIGTFPNKIGNGYFGDPNDHTAVVFDGQITYDKVTSGGVQTGGAQIVFNVLSNNTFANFTVQKYGAYLDRLGGGPWSDTGAGVLWRNLLCQDNFRSGLKLGGSNHEVRFCTFQFNGRYGSNGGGTNNHFYNCDTLSCGDDNMETRGLTPRPGTGQDPGGRGIGKYVHSNGLGHHNCRFRDQQGAGGKGLWYDINNQNALVEDCLFENIDRFACDFELSHGGSILRNTFKECNIRTGSPSWRSGVIHIATGGPTLIDGNDIQNTIISSSRSGIMLWQHNRDTAGDNQNPPFWSGLCNVGGNQGVRNNLIRGFTYPMAVTCSYTKDGCNFTTTPSSITIENNDEGSVTKYWRNSEVTPSEWAALGYS